MRDSRRSSRGARGRSVGLVPPERSLLGLPRKFRIRARGKAPAATARVQESVASPVTLTKIG